MECVQMSASGLWTLSEFVDRLHRETFEYVSCQFQRRWVEPKDSKFTFCFTLLHKKVSLLPLDRQTTTAIWNIRGKRTTITHSHLNLFLPLSLRCYDSEPERKKSKVSTHWHKIHCQSATTDQLEFDNVLGLQGWCVVYVSWCVALWTGADVPNTTGASTAIRSWATGHLEQSRQPSTTLKPVVSRLQCWDAPVSWTFHFLSSLTLICCCLFSSQHLQTKLPNREWRRLLHEQLVSHSFVTTTSASKSLVCELNWSLWAQLGSHVQRAAKLATLETRSCTHSADYVSCSSLCNLLLDSAWNTDWRWTIPAALWWTQGANCDMMSWRIKWLSEGIEKRCVSKFEEGRPTHRTSPESMKTKFWNAALTTKPGNETKTVWASDRHLHLTHHCNSFAPGFSAPRWSDQSHSPDACAQRQLQFHL